MAGKKPSDPRKPYRLWALAAAFTASTASAIALYWVMRSTDRPDTAAAAISGTLTYALLIVTFRYAMFTKGLMRLTGDLVKEQRLSAQRAADERDLRALARELNRMSAACFRLSWLFDAEMDTETFKERASRVLDNTSEVLSQFEELELYLRGELNVALPALDVPLRQAMLEVKAASWFFLELDMLVRRYQEELSGGDFKWPTPTLSWEEAKVGGPMLRGRDAVQSLISQVKHSLRPDDVQASHP